ncbi:MAG: MATE family efflux transporter [Oscillospiraceae bacterium]|nr:MATE family efflux transporter [Oscillospiraceae bacterium]
MRSRIREQVETPVFLSVFLLEEIVEQIRDFTRGPILRPLLSFSVPILLALFLQALYGAVDLLVVGRFALARDVSGVAVGSQIMQTVTGLVSSFAMGTTILLGQRIGAGRREEGGRIIGTSVMFFVLVGAALTALLPLLSGKLAQAMNAPDEAFTQTRRYLAICGLGSVMIVAYNVLGSIMRGLGDSKTPLMTVAIASVCNIAGDLLLVAGLHMGAEGAAIATVASQTVSVLISLLVLSRRTFPFSFSKRDIHLEVPILRRIIRFGFPIALQDLLVGLSFLVVLAIVNTLGLTASAGVGVAEKVCAFIMLIPAAFMQAMSAYVAQNHGAGKDDRAEQGLRLAVLVSTAFGALMFYAAYFHGDLLCGFFARDADVIAAGYDYLRAYGIDCLLTCFLFCFIGFFNGLGKTGFVMVQGIAAAFLIRIPVAWWMSRATGRLFYIGLSIPCSTVVQIAACFVFLAYIRREGVKSHAKTTV